MSVRNRKRAPLARAVALGLFALCSVPQAFAQQIVVTSGTHDIGGNTYATTGADAPTISASNTDTSIIGDTVTATTSGTGSRAIEVLSNAVIELDNVSLTTSGIGGVGIYADTDGNVSLANSRITTTGATAWGVHNATGGGVVTLTGSEINSGSRGVMAEGGTTDLVDTNITSTQEAIRASIAGTQVSVSGGTLQSSAAVTIDARSSAAVSLSDTAVVGAAGRNAVYIDGSTLSVDGGTITAGTDGTGIFLLNDASMSATGVAVTSGETGIAVRDAIADVANATISNVERGLVLGSATTADVTRATLTGVNVDAALDAISLGGNEGASTTLSISGGTLRGGETGVLVTGGTHALSLANGAQVSSGTGRMIDVQGIGVLAATLDGVELAGNTSAGSIADLDIAFRNGATLTGAMANTRMVDLAAGTTWYVTGESDVESVLHTGTIQFTELPANQPFRTLTVHRDYTGFGGLLVLNTVLEDDHRYTDLLHVEGHTSGNTRLRILNMGGAGVQTAAEGIRVVQVDGESLGTFTLDGRVVAGAYDYNLFQGGLGDDQDDGDWYLRSALTQEPGGPGDPGDPGDPGGPGGPGDGLFRPEVGAYLGNQAATLTMFRHHRGDRVADQYTGEDVEPRSVWVRAHQHHLDTRVAHDQVSSGTDTRTTELGAELMHWTLDKVNLAVGAIYSEGSADSTETSRLSGYTAKGSLDGRAFTLFGTWSTHPGGRTGWYLDQWLQFADFKNTVQGQDLAPERFSSKRRTASAEGGYGFLLHQSERFDLVLQPQVQVVYSDFDMPLHVEANGTVVQTADPGAWSARAGVRLMGTIDRVLRPYFEFNAWDDARAVSMQFDDALVSMAPTGRVNEYNAGLSVGGNSWSGWASLGVQNGEGGLRGAQGQLGVRYRW